MAEYVQSITVGTATVTLINVWDLRSGTTEDGTQLSIPVVCVMIQVPGAYTLVDATVYDLPPDSPHALPGYQPPPGLLARLHEIGVQPDQIAHVVITHAHWDHFSGLTQTNAGGNQPCFPNARHYLGRADWEHPDMKAQLADANSLASRTLLVVQREGLLELVSGNRRLSSEIEILAAPGETPGHQIVRVHSGGETFYCLGDVYHEVDEVEHPERMADWADPDVMGITRRSFIDAALAENARLTATHIPTIGRLRRTASGVIWDNV